MKGRPRVEQAQNWDECRNHDSQHGAFPCDSRGKQEDKKVFRGIFFSEETTAFPGYHQDFHFLICFIIFQLSQAG